MAEEKIKNNEEARRFARVIVSDISVYNAEKIADGIKSDKLFEFLKNELDEGETYYRSKVDSQLYESSNFFYEAVVDILLKQKKYIASQIW